MYGDFTNPNLRTRPGRTQQMDLPNRRFRSRRAGKFGWCVPGARWPVAGARSLLRCLFTFFFIYLFSLDHFTRKLQAALLPTTHCGHKQPALKENKTIRKPGTAEHQLWWFLCPSLVFWVLTLSFFSFFFFLSEPPRFEVQLQCAVFIMEVL